MNVKIAHCADVHLISEEIGDHKLYRNLLKAFRDMIDICSKEKVDILLIAGDLFDSSNIDSTTLSTIQSSLKNLDTRVFISPGNHDYLSLDSPYLESSWPDNVKIFSPEVESFPIEELNTTVYGVGFDGSFVNEFLFNEPIDIDHSMINICICHGDLVNTSGNSQYHPISKEDISRMGVDYLALGHIHKRSEMKKAGNTYYSYPGSLLGRGFDEIGSKGFYIGTISEQGIEFNFKEIDCPGFFIDRVDMTGVESEEEVYNKIYSQIKNNYKNYKDNSYRIILEGEIPSDFRVSWISIEDRLSDIFYYIKLIDKMKTPYNLELLRQETSLKGVFTNKMLNKIDETNDENLKKVYERSLKYGLEAFEGEVRINEY